MAHTTQTLTELLEQVDWSRMRVNRLGEIRKGVLRNWCPLAVATESEASYFTETVLATGLDGIQVAEIMCAADDDVINPARARWRQWMLTKIHEAHAHAQTEGTT